MISWFKDCNYKTKSLVGGKNASLGELYNLSEKLNFNIANGFAITTTFYQTFIENNNISHLIEPILNDVDCDDIEQLNNASNKIKDLFKKTTFSKKEIDVLFQAYDSLKEMYNNNIEVAVRSSAVCEDLDNASFAGQQDTYLNITNKNELLNSVKNCFASLFNSRAISYRKSMNYTNDVTISVCIQKMVRSDLGKSGVAFSIDSESGFKKSILINASWGLGEMVVGGKIKPDEFIVFKDKLEDYLPIIDKKLGNKTHKMIYGNNPNTLTGNESFIDASGNNVSVEYRVSSHFI